MKSLRAGTISSEGELPAVAFRCVLEFANESESRLCVDRPVGWEFVGWTPAACSTFIRRPPPGGRKRPKKEKKKTKLQRGKRTTPVRRVGYFLAKGILLPRRWSSHSLPTLTWVIRRDPELLVSNSLSFFFHQAIPRFILWPSKKKHGGSVDRFARLRDPLCSFSKMIAVGFQRAIDLDEERCPPRSGTVWNGGVTLAKSLPFSGPATAKKLRRWPVSPHRDASIIAFLIWAL